MEATRREIGFRCRTDRNAILWIARTKGFHKWSFMLEDLFVALLAPTFAICIAIFVLRRRISKELAPKFISMDILSLAIFLAPVFYFLIWFRNTNEPWVSVWATMLIVYQLSTAFLHWTLFAGDAGQRTYPPMFLSSFMSCSVFGIVGAFITGIEILKDASRGQ